MSFERGRHLREKRRIEKLLKEANKHSEMEYKHRRPVYYYGRRPKNYATRQQMTKRLLKQAGISYSFNVLRDMQEAGISYTRRNIVKDAFITLGVFQ